MRHYIFSIFCNLSWDVTKTLGQSKILRTSYFFFLTIPVAAKLLSTFPETIKVPYINTEIELLLTLPFSWVAFFVAAVFATIGNLSYLVFCPKLIRDFRDFNEFCDSKRNGETLQNSIVELSLKEGKAKMLECVEEFDKRYSLNLDTYKSHQAVIAKTAVEPDLFYAIRDVVNISRPKRRFLCLASFGMSFGLIAFVFCENIGYVLGSA